MAAAIRRRSGEADGSLLAFLPGVAEIERTAERLEALPAGRRPPPPPRQPRARRPARRNRRRAAGPAQARPRHLDRRDQPDPRRSADRRRFRPRPPAPLRPRRRNHPAGHRARQPGRRDPARRPRRAAGAGDGLPALGGGGDGGPAALRPARDRRSRSQRAAARLRALGRRPTRASSNGSTRPRPPPSTKRGGACSRSARSTRTAARPPTAGPSPPCRCRRASPTCWSKRRRAAGAGPRPRWRSCCRSAGSAATTSTWSSRLRRWRGRAGPAGGGGAGAGEEVGAVSRHSRRKPGSRRSPRPLGRRTVPAFAGNDGQGGDDGLPASPSPSPTASPAAAIPPARTGSAPAAAASGSIRTRRSPARPGSRSARSAAPPPAPGSSPPPRSREAEVEALFGDRIESGAQLSFDPATGTVRARRGRRLGRDHACPKARTPQASPDEVAAALRRRSPQPRPAAPAVERPAPGRCAGAPPSPASTTRACPTCPTTRCSPSSTNGCLCCVAGRRGLRDVDPAALSGMLDAPPRLGGPQGGGPARAPRLRDSGRKQPRHRL